jgi:hypothetical protein
MHSAIVVVDMSEKSEAEGHHPKWLAFEADLLTPRRGVRTTRLHRPQPRALVSSAACVHRIPTLRS